MEEDFSLPLFLAHKEEAIVASFKKEKKRLLTFIRNKISNKEEAEDILQEVYFQLIKSFTPLEPIEKVSSWLFQVARNKIIDKYRKKKTISFSEIPQDEYNLNLVDIIQDPSSNPEDSHYSTFIWEAIEEALSELPAEQTRVFIMHEIEGKSFKEIAEITGASLNTLLSRKRYAVIHLRKRLQNLYNEL